jgi:hypothetical protein
LSLSAGARGGRRLAVLPLLAAVLAAGACSGAKDGEGDEEAGVASAVDSAAAEAPPAAPAPGVPWTPEDSLRAAQEDSIQEARLMRARQASMESYAGCMEKAKSADPEHRGVLEAACQRGRGAAGETPR